MIQARTAKFRGHDLRILESSKGKLYFIWVDGVKTFHIVRAYLQENHGLSELLAMRLAGDWHSQCNRIRIDNFPAFEDAADPRYLKVLRLEQELLQLEMAEIKAVEKRDRK